MKLKLELYPDIALLRITGTIETADIQILRAGILKILNLPISWLFIDAGLAVLTQAQSYGLMELRYLKSTVHAECVLPYTLPGAFKTVEGALSVCTSRLAMQLREKMVLQQKSDELTDKLEMLKLQSVSFKKQGKSIPILEEENRQLRQLHTVLHAGLKAGGVSEKSARPVQIKSSPEAMKNLFEVKKSWILWLKKNGVLT